MKFVFINRYFYPDLSATSQLLTDLAVALAAAGHDVHVVTSRLLHDDLDRRLPSVEQISGVNVHRVWTSRFGRARLAGRAVDYLTFYASAGGCLLRLLKRGDVLVIKTDPPLIGLIATPCARVKGAKVVNWVQDLFPEVAQQLGLKVTSGVVGRWLLAWRNACLRRADMNVVLGERMADRLSACGVAPERLRIIHNWANGDAIMPLGRRENFLRERWQLGDAFVVGYSGNLGRAHEFDALLSAATLLRDRSDIVFLIIGDGHARAALASAVSSRGLTQVRFQPYQPREMLPYSLTLFDAHLVSLRPELEGLIVPSKLYGALAAGRPVVFMGDPDGEAARVVRQCDCGVTVAPGDGQALARTILSWCDDRQRLASLGEHAREAFVQRFSRQHALAQWAHTMAQQAQVLSA
ncbi:MAG: glycosyltransferase family 4 protein [Aquabacterium sp.]